MNRQPKRVRCISQPCFRDTTRPVSYFTVGKEYDVTALKTGVWVVIDDGGDENRIRNPKFDKPGQIEWWTKYFVIVMDDVISSYNRAMGILK